MEKAFLPGRFEIRDKVRVYTGIKLILAGAHTLTSIRLTVDTLNKLFGSKKINLLFACAADKDVKDMAQSFKYRFSHIYLTRPGEKKISDLDTAITAFKDAELDFTADADYKKIIRSALEKSAEENAVLLVTGSFYLVSEVEEILASVK